MRRPYFRLSIYHAVSEKGTGIPRVFSFQCSVFSRPDDGQLTTKQRTTDNGLRSMIQSPTDLHRALAPRLAHASGFDSAVRGAPKGLRAPQWGPQYRVSGARGGFCAPRRKWGLQNAGCKFRVRKAVGSHPSSLKPQASSLKPQASSLKPSSSLRRPRRGDAKCDIAEAKTTCRPRFLPFTPPLSARFFASFFSKPSTRSLSAVGGTCRRSIVDGTIPGAHGQVSGTWPSVAPSRNGPLLMRRPAVFPASDTRLGTLDYAPTSERRGIRTRVPGTVRPCRHLLAGRGVRFAGVGR